MGYARDKSSLRRRPVFLAAFVIAACMAITACAGSPRLTPEASLDYARFALRDLPPEIDLGALEGKRIVIDPGHGGEFPGAVGPNNLREADVNLGVGLYLWGMLSRAGAEAHLTRATDSVVYEGDDLDLKKDLQARAEIAKKLEADLFVSLHHNADVLPDKKKNSLETYFKMSDAGPSLDIARSIHRHLAISLEQDDNVILPGNFHVLRENPVTAVLGEPSYISHARNAFRLGLAPMQRVEAQAYFLGIAEYFSKGVPKIEGVSPVGAVRDNARPLITAHVGADRGVEIDPASITMLIDEKAVRPDYDRASSDIRYLPPRRLSNGRHRVRISVRNLNGNASRPIESEFEIAMPPAYVLLDSNFREVRNGNAAPIRLRARMFDADLMPVADGASVKFRASEGLISPNPSLTRNGEAVAYLVPDKGGAGPREISVSAAISGRTHTMKVKVSEDAPEFVAAKVVDAGSGLSVENALISIEGKPLGHSDLSGYFAIERDELGSVAIKFSRRGYEPRMLDTLGTCGIQTVRMRPVAGGVLFDRRFVLDPRLGGEEKGATGPTGVRASDLNLSVANYLARFLEASGARVVLTRTSDETVSALRRVEVEERFDAEWFISIGHGDSITGDGEPEAVAQAGVTHYPTSKAGKRLAASIAKSIESRKIAESVALAKDTEFVLTHTGSPAVIVQGPSPATAEMEQMLRHPAAARNEAYAIYCGILENLGLGDDETGRISVRVVDDDGNVFQNAALVLDGAFNMGTAPGGEFTFSKIVPGDHSLEVYAGRLPLWDGYVCVGPGGETSVVVSFSGPAAVLTSADEKTPNAPGDPRY